MSLAHMHMLAARLERTSMQVLCATLPTCWKCLGRTADNCLHILLLYIASWPARQAALCTAVPALPALEGGRRQGVPISRRKSLLATSPLLRLLQVLAVLTSLLTALVSCLCLPPLLQLRMLKLHLLHLLLLLLLHAALVPHICILQRMCQVLWLPRLHVWPSLRPPLWR